MALGKVFAWLPALALLSGCATNKALMDLSPETRAHVQFAPTEQRPSVRFASEGARQAREFGFIGLAVASGIEHSTNGLGKSAGVIGAFEAQAIQDLFLKQLGAAAIDFESRDAAAAQLTLTVEALGLREVERYRFAPFAAASARLVDLNGKELWSARAKSTGTELHPLQAFSDEPDLYRRGFHEAANDLANQLIQGPIRAITF